MRELSPTAWIVLICLGSFILLSYISLFGLFRKKNQKPTQDELPKDPRAFLKNPWEDEDQQWDKLSQEVKKLSDSTSNKK